MQWEEGGGGGGGGALRDLHRLCDTQHGVQYQLNNYFNVAK